MPFVDVLVRLEDLGAAYQIEDDGLMATSSRSGDAIRLGDRMFIEVSDSDCAILRRTVYAKRVRSADEAADDALARSSALARGRGPGGGGASSPARFPQRWGSVAALAMGAPKGRAPRAGRRRRVVAPNEALDLPSSCRGTSRASMIA
jgi:hypothetical protein